MQTISVGELKANFSQILDLVQNQKEEFIIEYGRNHKKVAKIVPFKEKKNFNPKEFFGIANFTKEEIDNYLEELKNEWDR